MCCTIYTWYACMYAYIVEFSGDGQTVVSGGLDNEIKVRVLYFNTWYVCMYACIVEFPGDGQTVVSGGLCTECAV